MESNVQCEVCGERKFTVKEGFYYCDECGVQSQNVREVEIFENYADATKYTHIKINKTTSNEVELTSWECFNYLLRGLSEEVSELGAKDNFKSTVLYLWSKYLRIREIAFFSKSKPELPKLDVSYSRRDAKILYNHHQIKKHSSKLLTWRHRKRNLAESDYQESQLESQSTTILSFSTQNSSSANSNRAIPLNFSRTARKYFKKYMPSSHIKKHEIDTELQLKCHDLHTNLGKKYRGEIMTRLTLYTIIYIALNLIGDNIQMADIIRFIREGHISSSNISHFFPDNATENCVELINMKKYYGRTYYCDDTLRNNALKMCRLLKISELKLPNLSQLSARYIDELNLPKDIFLYVDRLQNFYKPQMHIKFDQGRIPFYEGRAMAYIIFVLKLLFGLDGHREKRISESAKIVNTKLKELGNEQKLFVFEDWVNFIEMRQVVIEHCISQKNSDEFIERLKFSTENIFEGKSHKSRQNLKNMQHIFEEIYNNQKEMQTSEILLSKFPPSLTPNRLYFEYIMQDYNIKDKLLIPEYLEINHTVLDIESYTNPSKLQYILNKNSIKLEIQKLNINTNDLINEYVINLSKNQREFKSQGLQKVEHNITEGDWFEYLSTKIPEKMFSVSNTHTKCNKHIYCKNNNVNIESDSNTVCVDSEENNIFINSKNDKNIDYTTHNYKESIDLCITNFDYWVLFGNIQFITKKQTEELEVKLPHIFMWLLKTCAKIIETDYKYLYQELLIIENLFANVLEPIHKMKNIHVFRADHSDCMITKTYKNLW